MVSILLKALQQKKRPVQSACCLLLLICLIAATPVAMIHANPIDTQACLPLSQRGTGEQRAINAHIFIETTIQADQADPQNIIRKKTLSILGDFLLVDSLLRGTENTLSVHFYASETLEIETLKFKYDQNSWLGQQNPLDAFHLAVHEFNKPAFSYPGRVSFDTLFEEAATKAETATGIPFIIVLNDMNRNSSTENFAEQAYEEWIRGEKFNSSFIYMLDFSSSDQGTFDQWKTDFFHNLKTDHGKGALLSLDKHAALFVLNRMMMEVTGHRLFQHLAANPEELPNCAFNQTFLYAEVSDAEFDGQNRTVASRLPTSGSADVIGSRYSFFTHIGNDARSVTPHPDNFNILFAYLPVGTPPTVTCPVRYVAPDTTINLEATMEEEDQTANLTLRWGNQGAATNKLASASSISRNGVFEWRNVGPLELSEDGQPQDYEFFIEGATAEDDVICTVSTVIMPEMFLHTTPPQDGQPLVVDVMIDHDANPLANATPSIHIIIGSTNEFIDAPRISTTYETTSTHRFVAGDIRDLPENATWEVHGTLNTHTNEGVPVSLHETQQFFFETNTVIEPCDCPDPDPCSDPEICTGEDKDDEEPDKENRIPIPIIGSVTSLGFTSIGLFGAFIYWWKTKSMDEVTHD